MADFTKIPVHLTPKQVGKFPNFIKVSNVDARKLSKFKWDVNPKGYAFTTSKGSGAALSRSGARIPVFAHQLVSARASGGIGFFTDPHGINKKFDVDHINRQRNDDRRTNLRQVTHKQNIANRGVSKKKFNFVQQKANSFRNGASTRDEKQFQEQLNYSKLLRPKREFTPAMQIALRKAQKASAKARLGRAIPQAVRQKISKTKTGVRQPNISKARLGQPHPHVGHGKAIKIKKS